MVVHELPCPATHQRLCDLGNSDTPACPSDHVGLLRSARGLVAIEHPQGPGNLVNVGLDDGLTDLQRGCNHLIGLPLSHQAQNLPLTAVQPDALRITRLRQPVNRCIAVGRRQQLEHLLHQKFARWCLDRNSTAPARTVRGPHCFSSRAERHTT